MAGRGGKSGLLWGAVLVVVLGGLALLVLDGAGRDEGARGAGPRRAADRPAADEDVTLAAPSEVQDPATEREHLGEPSAADLADAHEVEGRVLFPPGTPADERAFVVARGRAFPSGAREHRAEVAADGRFTVRFAPSTRTGHVLLEARYAYLTENVRWSSSEPAPLVLEPRLGGCLEGRLVAPEGADAGGRLDLEPAGLPADRSDDFVPRARTVGSAGEFTFGGLPPGPVYLTYDGPELYASLTSAEVAVGEARDVAIRLLRGATLVGRVVDPGGTPVAGVRVSARALVPGTSVERIAESGQDGEFRLAGLPPERIELGAERPGTVPALLELTGLAEGEVRAGLQLVLGRGGAIGGRVLGPDGSPVRAEVYFVPERGGDLLGMEELWRAERTVESGEDGRFAFGGLEGPQRVVATVLEKGERRARLWRAEAREVEPGTLHLELVLSDGLAIEGRVVDERGIPVRGARVGAFSPGDPRAGPDEVESGADGRFTLTGIHPSTWILSVYADAHLPLVMQEVSLPADAPLELVLRRGSVVSGSVLDPLGRPIEMAIVSAKQLTGDFHEQTGPDGSFRIEVLPDEPVTVSATHGEHAPTEALTFTLAVGERREDLRLRLRTAGVVLGEVLARDGRPLSGVGVYAEDAAGLRRHAVTRRNGSFQLEGCTPGEARVVATTVEGFEIEGRVTVEAGRPVRIQLREPATTVRVFGRVTLDGRPAPGALVRSSPRATGVEGPQAHADADGTYALRLPEPGEYWLGASPPQLSTQQWRAFTVPVAPEFRVDFDLVTGRVSGRVLDEEGAPVPEVWVQARQTSEDSHESGWGGALSDADGRYELALPSGVYALTAGGREGTFDGRSFVSDPVEDVAVAAGGHLRGVDVHVRTGALLAGTVRLENGNPVPGAQLWIAPAGGGQEGEPLCTADERGAFHVQGVEPGAWSVTATAEGLYGDWREVELEPGRLAELDVRMVPAAWLHVRVLAAGREVVADEVLAVFADERHQPGSEDGEGGFWIGPLPLGRYRVVASLGERTGSVEVELVEDDAGGREVVVELE